MSAVLAPHSAPSRPPRAFDGTLPDPALAGIYRYTDVFEKPFTGPQPRRRAEQFADVEFAAPMARWLTENDHTRPFFRDRDFIAEFGRLAKSEAIAVANAMWSRADRAAAAAGTKITLPARLGGDPERS
ncbi:MAG: hypothetical protein J0H88_13830 [Sphingomonadales bacterium]|nr:hypothetical protein [Sphingomonadales bacterium]